MFIQCFITKVDGSPVFVDYEGVRYIFQKNEFGDAVCYVGNQGHVRRLLLMGPACYQEYDAPEEATTESTLGAAPVPLGGQEKRPMTNPLPDGQTVDESLIDHSADVEVGTEPEPPDILGGPEKPDHTAGEQGAGENEAAVDDTVEWAGAAVKTKIKEFKYLSKEDFKTFVEANRGSIGNWPETVKDEVAKKLINKFPGEDPEIEGLNLDDYHGRGNTGDS